MTQNQMILSYMRDKGGITARDAINEIGCMRLAARISELRRDGYSINSRTVKRRNRFGETCYVSEYTLEEWA